MAKVVPLFSGSKGNCYYIGTSAQGVLIDAGRSCKQIELAMEANGLSMKNVSALFITHEHTDHCSAVKVLSRGLYPETKLEVIESELALCDMNIRRINTPHDAAESCCYRVTASDGKSALIATDMGVMLPEVRAAAQNSDFVVLESNHDIDMLRFGEYPYPLKKRILSDRGHLSNDACAAELAEMVKSGTLRLMLGHLSEHNNTPEIAARTAVAALQKEGMKRNLDFTLDIAPGEPQVGAVIF